MILISRSQYQSNAIALPYGVRYTEVSGCGLQRIRPMDFFRVFPYDSIYLNVLCSEPVRLEIALEAHAELFLPTGRSSR